MFTSLIKGEVARYLKEMSNEDLLHWVDEMVVAQLNDYQVELLSHRLQARLADRRHQQYMAILDLTPGIHAR